MTEIPYEENLMAAATTRRRTATKTAPKPAPAVEPEELDEDMELEEDLDEMEEDEVADTKPVAKKSAAAAEVTFGIRDLVELVEKKTGQKTDPRGLRTLIRKMARDGSGRVDREITPGNRTRYDWSGPNDPEVLKIVAAFEAGELEAEKKAKLDELKSKKAAKTAEKKKAAAAVEEAEDEGEDEDEAEEAPKPARRTRAAAKKTTPARRTRKAPEPELVEDDEELELDDEE